MEGNINSQMISAATGIVISILLETVPGLNTWWAEQNSQLKSLITVVIMIFVGIGIYLLSCYSPYTYVECTTNGAWATITIVVNSISAYIGSQAGHNGAKWFGPEK